MQKYKKDFVYLTFSRVFFATACIADFHIAQAFGHLCPTMWGIFTQGFGHGYPRLWASVPMYVGMDTRVRGYECPWAWAELFCFSALLARVWQ